MRSDVRKKIRSVSAGVNDKLAKQHADPSLDSIGRGTLREGYDGGYVQALYDVQGYLDGYTNSSSPHQELWEPPA